MTFFQCMQRRRVKIVSLGTAILALAVAPAAATSSGIIGASGKQGPSFTCVQCHSGGTAPMVEFDGPTQLAPDTVGTFVFRVRSQSSQQTHGGFDVAVDAGTLDIDEDGQQAQVLFGELTHSQPKRNVDGVAEWEFTWRAPATEGTFTLFGAGNSVNRDSSTTGDRSAATTRTVRVAALPSPTPTPTATPTRPAVPCVGDCNGDNQVTVDELLIGVNIALGRSQLQSCPEFNVVEDTKVAVNELVAGLNALLKRCLP